MKRIPTDDPRVWPSKAKTPGSEGRSDVPWGKSSALRDPLPGEQPGRKLRRQSRGGNETQTGRQRLWATGAGADASPFQRSEEVPRRTPGLRNGWSGSNEPGWRFCATVPPAMEWSVRFPATEASPDSPATVRSRCPSATEGS